MRGRAVFDSKRRWCSYCDRYVRVVYNWRGWAPGPHEVLCVLTCGLWLPVMIWDAMRSKYICVNCGKRL